MRPGVHARPLFVLLLERQEVLMGKAKETKKETKKKPSKTMKEKKADKKAKKNAPKAITPG
jgi:hypothetical protein